MISTPKPTASRIDNIPIADVASTEPRSRLFFPVCLIVFFVMFPPSYRTDGSACPALVFCRLDLRSCYQGRTDSGLKSNFTARAIGSAGLVLRTLLTEPLVLV